MLCLKGAMDVLIPDWANYILKLQLFPAQIVFTVIVIVAFGLIATGRLNRTMAALGGAVATLGAGYYFALVYSWVPIFNWFVSKGFVTSGLLFSFEDVYKEFISWSTLLIIISVVIITTVASRSGLFEYIILRVVKFSGGDIRKLFLYLCVLSFVLTMILGNNPTLIIMSALIFLIVRILDFNPVPYILGVLFVINAASTSTVIGSFVNLLISGYYNLDPTRYLSYPNFLLLGLPFGVISAVIALFFLFHYHKEAFQVPMDKEEFFEIRSRLLSLDEHKLMRDPKLFQRISILLIATILTFVVAGFFGVPFYVVALLFAVLFLIISGENPEKTLREVNWSLIFFFIGIFIMVGGLNSTGVLENFGSSLGKLTATNVPLTATLVTTLTSILSGVLYNISVTSALLYVIPSLSASALINQNLVIWSLIYGANIGASLTPIGGLPSLIAVTSLEKEGYPISWIKFIKIGAPITLVSVVAGILLLIGYSHILGWGIDLSNLLAIPY
jgi:Na+/H+ antiporter NhaD/arsenite permease-like protein